MAIKKYGPTTPGRRGMTVTDYSVLSKVAPERSLLEPMKKHSGRNNTGRTPVRTVTSRPDWCMWACASPQASPRTMPKCSKPSNSILMACAKRFVASPYSTFCKT